MRWSETGQSHDDMAVSTFSITSALDANATIDPCVNDALVLNSGIELALLLMADVQTSRPQMCWQLRPASCQGVCWTDRGAVEIRPWATLQQSGWVGPTIAGSPCIWKLATGNYSHRFRKNWPPTTGPKDVFESQRTILPSLRSA